MTSSSTQGSTTVVLTFNLDRDIDAAAQDVQAAIAQTLRDLPRDIASQPGVRRADYAVIASQVSLPVELRQGEAGGWADYLVQAVDEAYLENIDYDIAVKAEGYSTAAEIWEAVRTHRRYAVVDRYAVPPRSTTSIMIGGPDFKLSGVYLEDETNAADPAERARAKQ